jgi:hypothetical protein
MPTTCFHRLLKDINADWALELTELGILDKLLDILPQCYIGIFHVKAAHRRQWYLTN